MKNKVIKKISDFNFDKVIANTKSTDFITNVVIQKFQKVLKMVFY